MPDWVWCEVHERNHPPGMAACPPPPARSAPPPPAGQGPIAPGGRPLPGLDSASQMRVQRGVAAARAIVALADDLGTTLERIAIWADDTIRATHYSGSGDQPMWCDTHDRDASRCDADDWTCQVEPYQPGADPTGETAAHHTEGRVMDVDRMTRRALAHLDNVHRAARALDRLVTDARVRLGSSRPGTIVDDEWCPSCMRLGKAEPPAMVRPGTRRYKDGLCGWCGPIAAEYRMWPALDLVRRHHEGRRLHATELERAMRSAGWKGSASRSKRQ